MKFQELDIVAPILRAVEEKGYEEPTPIQQEAIPVVMAGKDIFGIARTGTGKTAAFAIPIIQQLMAQREKEAAEIAAREAEEVAKAEAEAARIAAEEAAAQTDVEQNETTEGGEGNEAESTTEPKAETRNQRRRRLYRERVAKRRNKRAQEERHPHTIRALILTPTRELALQISDCFTDYGKYSGLRHTAIFGGVKQKPQTDALRKGVDILIATPGRLLDLMGQGAVKLNNLSTFVLDEADRMLDMGFIGDIRRLLTKLPSKRQTLFFSATMPDEIVRLSRSMLHHPVRIEVTPASSTVDEVEQCVYFVEKPEKRQLLIELLQDYEDKSALIFSRTKHGAENIAKALRKEGMRCDALHGDKSQTQRQRALDDFKSGKSRIMVATDIAARGIDIKELGMVINYDIPDVPETYVHRIGRTGRAGCAGLAFTFCTLDEHAIVKDIQRLTGGKIDTVLYGDTW